MKAIVLPAPYLLASLLVGLVALAASPASATSALYLTGSRRPNFEGRWRTVVGFAMPQPVGRIGAGG